ncbi:MAG: AmmeMemoRadiSam system protein B [Candidatus Omnitrophota bacterium]
MSESLIRKPAVSGQFYPGSAQKLEADIEKLIDTKAQRAEAIGCVLPHAGYMYSGGVAGKTVSCVIPKDNVVLLGPNHTGFGAAFSVMAQGYWQTPLGKIEVNSELARAILNKSGYLSEDALAHAYEHSIEVELPFLQYFNSAFRIVPIVVTEGEISVYKEIGRSIAAAIKELNLEKSTLIVASSDMTHYEPQYSAERKDKEAIQAILELDEDKLIEKVKKLNISMCGYVPATIMLAAAKLLGAKSAQLVSYRTSGDVTGDYTAVVGYAGIVVR